jgi:hypothetical protein
LTQKRVDAIHAAYVLPLTTVSLPASDMKKPDMSGILHTIKTILWLRSAMTFAVR